MRRTVFCCLALLTWCGADMQAASAQGYPGGGGQVPGGHGMNQPHPGGDISPPTTSEKPDAAARKAFKAGVKSLNRAREFQEVADRATNPDKKADALDKVNDAYGKALDQFTEALSNKGDMVEAWNNAAYVHLQLGAFNEAIDDYNHTLSIKPDLLDAIEGRAEAFVGTDRLDQAKAAYMDLFNHEPLLADKLMSVMQKWLQSHREAANGMRAADIDSFGKWLEERAGIAKQAAAANPATSATFVPPASTTC
ncbi:MAG: tetratricopeptide repeat protein [Gammaproteobacteria bacterium]